MNSFKKKETELFCNLIQINMVQYKQFLEITCKYISRVLHLLGQQTAEGSMA